MFRHECIQLTSISIAREVAAPFDKCATLKVSTSDRVAADGAEHTRVRELWGGRDNGVCDVVVDRLQSSSEQTFFYNHSYHQCCRFNVRCALPA